MLKRSPEALRDFSKMSASPGFLAPLARTEDFSLRVRKGRTFYVWMVESYLCAGLQMLLFLEVIKPPILLTLKKLPV